MSRPLYNRIWELTSRVEVKYMLGQSVSNFQMTEVIAGNKIRLVNLNGSRVGRLNASIGGTLIVNALWQAVRTVQAGQGELPLPRRCPLRKSWNWPGRMPPPVAVQVTSETTVSSCSPNISMGLSSLRVAVVTFHPEIGVVWTDPIG
jgi:hypothetical protein